LKTLDAKLAQVKGPGSRKLAVDLAAAVELGNEHDRLNGLDRYGRPQTPLKSKRKGKYAGAKGPPLAPFGAASRVVRNFKAKVKGSRPPYSILAGWEGVVSDKGVPFLPFHDQGAVLRRRSKGPGGGGRPGIFARAFARIRAAVTGVGYLPKRPIFGISPNTWRLIRERIDEFKDNVRKAR
jgi:hypothetical protein